MYPNKPGQPNPPNQPQPGMPQPQPGQPGQSMQTEQSYQFSPQFQPQMQPGSFDPYQQQLPQPQPNQPQAQPEYLQRPNQAPAAPPNKKLVIFGGLGLLIVMITVGTLLFGGNADSVTWSNLMYSGTQIPAITNKYNKDISSAKLQNSAATIQATWQSNNSDMTGVYKSVVGKSAKNPSSTLDKKTKESLDTSKNEGNLDRDYKDALIKQLKLVDKDASTLLQGDLSKKTKDKLKSTKELVKISLKLLSDT